MSEKNTLRIMTISLPRWPVQRQLLQQPGFRELPVFVCRQNARGVLSVVSWAWVMPPAKCQEISASYSAGLFIIRSIGGTRFGVWPTGLLVWRVLFRKIVLEIFVYLRRWVAGVTGFLPLVAIGPEVIRGAGRGKARRQSVCFCQESAS